METIAHHHHKTTDANGNIIDVVTDLNVTDYRHTCRTCKELESVFYSQKITPAKKSPRDVLTPRSKQNKPQYAVQPNEAGYYTELQLKSFD